MRRHRFDPLSFVFGITFIVIALTLSITGLALDPSSLRWIGAGVLIALGALMVFTPKSGADR